MVRGRVAAEAARPCSSSRRADPTREGQHGRMARAAMHFEAEDGEGVGYQGMLGKTNIIDYTCHCGLFTSSRYEAGDRVVAFETDHTPMMAPFVALTMEGRPAGGGHALRGQPEGGGMAIGIGC